MRSNDCIISLDKKGIYDMGVIRKQVGPELKEQILQELHTDGVVISDIARNYGISEKTIYGWRGKSRKFRKDGVTNNTIKHEFIELQIAEERSLKLKKAELTFSVSV